MDKCEQDTRWTLDDLVWRSWEHEGRTRLDRVMAMYGVADELLPGGRKFRGHLSWASVQLILEAAGMGEDSILPTP